MLKYKSREFYNICEQKITRTLKNVLKRITDRFRIVKNTLINKPTIYTPPPLKSANGNLTCQVTQVLKYNK